MNINTDKMKEFLKQEHIQEAMERNDIEYVYDKFYYASNGFTNVLTDFLIDMNIQPIDYISKVLEQIYYCCSSIRNITIPKSIETIGAYAFKGCHDLQTVIIEDGVKRIQSEAFAFCDKLDITIPPSVEEIYLDAFEATNHVIIRCYNGSVAHQFADENNIDYILID